MAVAIWLSVSSPFLQFGAFSSPFLHLLPPSLPPPFLPSIIPSSFFPLLIRGVANCAGSVSVIGIYCIWFWFSILISQGKVTLASQISIGCMWNLYSVHCSGSGCKGKMKGPEDWAVPVLKPLKNLTKAGCICEFQVQSSHSWKVHAQVLLSLICKMGVSKGCCIKRVLWCTNGTAFLNTELFSYLSVLIQLKFSGLYLRMIPKMLEGDEGI